MNAPIVPPDPPPGRLIEPQRYRPPGLFAALPRLQLPWRTLLLLAALLPWAGATWYVFSARAVAIVTDPGDAQLALPGWPAPHWHGRWLLLPGVRRVTARAPGYVPFDGTIEVGEAGVQDLPLALVRLPGALRVMVTPALPAQVVVDGVARGTAPGVVADIAAGSRAIEIRADRYRTFRAQVDVEGKGVEQALAATLEPAWTTLSISSNPPGARLSVDDQALGPTPFSGEILEGRRLVRLTGDGLKPWQQLVDVVAGTPLRLGPVTLAKADGHLELSSTPAGATVRLDGSVVGHTPLTVAVSQERKHRLRLDADGFEPLEQEVKADAGASTSLALTLTLETGTVEFVTQPADAELLVDGELRGSASQTLRLPARAHEFVVRARGYASYLGEVTPQKGVDKRYRIRLKTPAEAAADEAAARNDAAGAAPPGGARAPERGSPAEPSARTTIAGNPAPTGDAVAPAVAVTTALGQQLLLFHPGRARLGSPPGDPAHDADGPEREVLLERPFYLAVKEVTNGEFRHFLSSHVSPPYRGVELNDDRQPVSDVDWRTAALYCNWLSRRDGLPPFYRIEFGEVLGINPAATGYRLPSAAEWEWAARERPGSAPTTYAWGDHYPPQGRSDNYADDSAAKLINGALHGYRDGFVGAAAVGSFSPNLLGLYDLGGNVAEWVHDYDGPVPAGDPLPRDPLGPATGSRHLIKGASWAQASEPELRLAHHDVGTAGRPDLGFRLARYAQ